MKFDVTKEKVFAHVLIWAHQKFAVKQFTFFKTL